MFGSLGVVTKRLQSRITSYLGNFSTNSGFSTEKLWSTFTLRSVLLTSSLKSAALLTADSFLLMIAANAIPVM